MSTTQHRSASPDVIREILSGDSLTLSAAASLFPHHRDKDSKARADPSTVWRWIRKGVRLPDGSRLHLEGARVGDKWLTSAAGLDRFVRRLTAAQLDEPTDLDARDPAERQRAVSEAGVELEQLGA